MQQAWKRRVDTSPLPPEAVAHRPLALVRDESAEMAFAGRYRLHRCRGEGGITQVYEATDLQTRQRVAVKMLRYELIRNQEARLRFQCEAQIMSRQVHPNVVTQLDHGHASGNRPFLVMEYLEGRNLGEIICQEGPLSADRAFRIAVQVCRGLQAAHCAGIIHRDVKPDNLFVCPGQDGRELVKIRDFGIGKVCFDGDPLARMIGALELGRVVGTPNYMSPEQVCDPDGVNEQADVFSLGTVLCEALTGLRPHDGRSGGTIIDAILGDPASATAAYRPDLARELGDIIEPARAHDRRERYPSARAFGDALTAVVRALGASVSACSQRSS